MLRLLMLCLFTCLVNCSIANAEENHRPRHDYTARRHEAYTENHHFRGNHEAHQHRHHNRNYFGDTRSYFGPSIPRYVTPGPRYFSPNHYQMPPRSPYGLFLSGGGPVLMYHGPNISIIVR